MKRICLLFIVTLVFSLVSGCGPKVMVPPLIELKQYEIIGVMEFASSAKGKLGSLATRKFIEEMRGDQGIVRIVELGPEPEVLKTAGFNRMSPSVYKEIGSKFNVNTIFLGQLTVSDVRPNAKYSPGFGFISFSAEVDANLNVQLIETSTGASIWSSSASETKKVGNISIFGGKYFDFDAEDPEKAYGKLADSLVRKVTKDFRVTWERK
jgi:hypothetical protein